MVWERIWGFILNWMGGNGVKATEILFYCIIHRKRDKI